LPCGTMIQIALRPSAFSPDPQALSRHIARRRQLGHSIGVEVEAHHLVASKAKPLRHAAAIFPRPINPIA